jgi:hypothetical protein
MIPAVPFYADDSSLKRPSCFWQPVKEAAAEMRRLILKCRMKKDEAISGSFRFKPMFLHSAFFFHPSVCASLPWLLRENDIFERTVSRRRHQPAGLGKMKRGNRRD